MNYILSAQKYASQSYRLHLRQTAPESHSGSLYLYYEGIITCEITLHYSSFPDLWWSYTAEMIVQTIRWYMPIQLLP